LIVSCPSCGTNYKRPVVPGPARARCGCCAGAIDLAGLRPYRIVRRVPPTAEDLLKAGAHLPIGLDEPALAARIAARVDDRSPAPLVPLASSPEMWDESEPLPEIPEMAAVPQEYARGDEGADEAEQAIADSAPERGSSLVVFGFWAAGGAIIGTGTSWTLGGTTLTGIVAGGLIGLAAAWGFLRWTSRP
jgi:hypothetical protein